jgi:hypothetical protein
VLVQASPPPLLDKKRALEIINNARHVFAAYANPKPPGKLPHCLPYPMFSGIHSRNAKKVEELLEQYGFRVQIRETPTQKREE